jgi:hypothetical protein
MPNILDAEPLIVARIQQQLPDLVTVAGFSTIAGAVQVGSLIPGAWIIAEGASVDGQSTRNRILERDQWSLLLMVPYQRDGQSIVTWESGAGSLIERLIQALHGWSVQQALRVEYQGREGVTYKEGYLEIKLRFETRNVIECNNF